MPSSLSFSATEILRKKLLVRNLTPYNKPGVYTSTSTPATGDLVQNDYSVIDSPDALIDNDPFSDKLYPLNEFGPNGGYNKNINGLINTSQNKSNMGPYGAYPPYTNQIQDYSTSFQKKLYVKNEYSPADGIFRYYDIGDVSQKPKNATYWGPPSFRPSLYSPFAVLLQVDPVGDSGPASLDSELAQIGVERAKYSFKQRVDQNVRAQTLGRVNILNGLQDPAQLALIIAGKRPIVSRDYKITSGGGNILSQGQDIVERIVGYTFPISPIPGSYYQSRDYNSTQSAVRAAGNGKRGGLFGLFGNRPTSPSQLFLDYTGSGQRAQLTQNLDTNKFRPSYNTGGAGIISALGNAITAAFAADQSESNYYVGSPQREPSFLTSPAGQVPIDPFGAQVSAPVYGPDILGKEYEGDEKNFKFGLAGRAFSSDGNITGGFSWVSGKWAPNAGRRQKPGGDYGEESPDFPSIQDQLVSTESINYEFKPGSILDDTQRLIDSQPTTGARFGHVGNAIDQTSKVFFDGYKEITKGSQVIKYSDGQANVGIEYCRVFTKDTPYYSFNDLQKKDGNIRKFSYSVLDSTFNLNIAPEKGGDWNGGTKGGPVKKYLFSIENLAWRTGYRPGYRVSDLPACEQGPNGGRVMWFPPYDLSFSEDTKPSFNETTFLGRPEPIYTYKNTSRSGTLKWKMVVDHPSILDLIVNKVLANEGDREKVDSIVDAFFAGCKKYDLYELAKIYNTVPLTELQAWQEVVNNPQITNEQYSQVLQSVQPEVGTGVSTGGGQTDATSQITLDEYKNLGFYFPNDYPKTGEAPYQDVYINYTSPGIKIYYQDNSTNKNETATFFSNIIEDNFTQLKEMTVKIANILVQKQASVVTINLLGTASSPSNPLYNKNLSVKRIESVINYFKTYEYSPGKTLAPYIENGGLVISGIGAGEEVILNSPKSKNTTFGSIDCSKNIENTHAQITSVNAMACRAALVGNIGIIPIVVNSQQNNNGSQIKTLEDGKKTQSIKPGSNNLPVVEPTKDLYKGASKKLLRYLLNECDYFEVLKADNPFIYDSIKEKIKYFQPAFHSTTPEGLNARLTFLQQCMRPGDTIPTIGPDGKKIYNDALNTSFGAPPVLVMRVGDFYNTKIIPTNIGFTYEKTFDMNPEGIGFQPMIVEVSLGFNFVGGSGLKNPIDTLQNALSFNYYANTEMYDERAEATEDTSKLDKEVVQALQNQQSVVGVSNLDNQISNDGGNTIGIYVATGTTASGETGTLSYGKFMDNFITQTQGYYQGVVNMFDFVLKNYNYGILSMLNSNGKGNQSYTTGLFFEPTKPVPLYGKPQNIQKYVDDSFSSLISIFNINDLPIFSSKEFQNPIITDSQKRLFKKNYTDYVNTYKTTFLNDLTPAVNTLVQSEQNYVFNIDRFNYVCGFSTGDDGKLDTTNTAIIYRTSGTTEIVNNSPVNSFTNMVSDYEKISDSNISFLTTDLPNSNLYVVGSYQVKNPGCYTTPFPVSYSFPTQQSNREYTLMSRALTNPNLKQGFLDALVKGLDSATKNAVLFYYSTSPTSVFSIWDKLNKEGIDLISKWKTSTEGLKYEKFTPPFEPNQKRVCIFEENIAAPNELKKALQSLYANKNENGNKSEYNLKHKFL